MPHCFPFRAPVSFPGAAFSFSLFPLQSTPSTRPTTLCTHFMKNNDFSSEKTRSSSHQVLNELGQSIGSALARIGAGDGAADDEAVDACLKEICTALLRVRGEEREDGERERKGVKKTKAIDRSLARFTALSTFLSTPLPSSAFPSLSITRPTSTSSSSPSSAPASRPPPPAPPGGPASAAGEPWKRPSSTS